MDSLVYQTLENIEIIAVDNVSTDRSYEILKTYEKNFPSKVIVYQLETHTDTPANGWNLGIMMARSQYIGFADSDDIMHLQAMEWMYDKAATENCDLVFAPFWQVQPDGQLVLRRKLNLSGPPTHEDLLLRGELSYWTKLIHRELLMKMGPIPECYRLVDLPYTMPLHSYAQRLGYVDKPIYFFFNRDESTSHKLVSKMNEQIVDIHQYALEHCNPEYWDMVFTHIVWHIDVSLRFRWPYTDMFIPELKGYWEEISNNERLTNDTALMDRLNIYNNMPDEPMPRIVYVNGFNGKKDESFWEHVREKAFYNGCSLVVLDESNCDITENRSVKEAYDDGNYEFVAGYFCVKNIYDHGGIYLDHRIIIDAPFNYLRYFNGFFSYIDEKNFSDWVFGARKGCSIFKSILDTYDQFYATPQMPLKDRIKNILMIECRVPLNGQTELFGYPVSIFAPEVMVVDITKRNTDVHICTHNFSEFTGNPDYVVLPKDSIKAITTNQANLMNYAFTQRINVLNCRTNSLNSKIRSLNNLRLIQRVKQYFQRNLNKENSNGFRR